jgi:hypothetical protein
MRNLPEPTAPRQGFGEGQKLTFCSAPKADRKRNRASSARPAEKDSGAPKGATRSQSGARAWARSARQIAVLRTANEPARRHRIELTIAEIDNDKILIR